MFEIFTKRCISISVFLYTFHLEVPAGSGNSKRFEPSGEWPGVATYSMYLFTDRAYIFCSFLCSLVGGVTGAIIILYNVLF